MRRLFGLAGLLPFFLLWGCVTPNVVVAPDALRDTDPVDRFRIEGRISVKTAEQSFSGSLDWLRSEAEEVLLLSGPLGQGAAEIRRAGDRVVLTAADGATISEASDELLMERALGLRLPLDGLVYWLSGLPRPGMAFRATAGEDGRVASLDQDGWHIEYSRYGQHGARWLPGRLFANRDGLEFRLVVDLWEVR